MQIATNLLKALFRNVYFINGTAYAGKSTAVKNLAAKYNGVACGENYHDALSGLADPEHQPALCYFQTMSGWQEFVNRTPDEYENWINATTREAAELEILFLIRLNETERPVFVDTNIPPSLLREISDYRRVAIMLSPQSTSVERFFDRPDPEKQFLLEQIRKSPTPEETMRRFKACIARINSPERYKAFENSGFFTHVRDDRLTPEDTMHILADHFGLNEK